MKTLRFYIFILISFVLVLSGCLNNNDNKSTDRKDYRLTVGLQNKSEFDVNASIIIADDSDNELLNKTLKVKSDRYNSTFIFCQRGTYFIRVEIDDNRRINYTLTINKYDSGVAFDIYFDKIEIQPPQKP